MASKREREREREKEGNRHDRGRVAEGGSWKDAGATRANHSQWFQSIDRERGREREERR